MGGLPLWLPRFSVSWWGLLLPSARSSGVTRQCFHVVVLCVFLREHGALMSNEEIWLFDDEQIVNWEKR